MIVWDGKRVVAYEVSSDMAMVRAAGKFSSLCILNFYPFFSEVLDFDCSIQSIFIDCFTHYIT